MTLRVLIVDDEPLARQRLQRLLRSEPDLSLLPACADGRSALAAVREHRPHLMFLDVQMPEMSGFDVLAELAELGTEHLPVVVFVTAYDHFAQRAFEAQALDYLLKPFGAERARTALERARTFLAGGARRGFERQLAGLVRATSKERGAPSVLVKKRGRVLVLRAEEIDHVEAYGDYVKLHAGKDTHLLRATLSDTEQKLAGAGFVRIHRSRLVNWQRVREFVADREHDAEVVLMDGVRLPASHGFLKDLQERLEARD